MGTADSKLTGPDFEAGIRADQLRPGTMLQGHAHGGAILLAQDESGVFAIGANCTHYGTALAGGIVVNGTVRCPLHHACFSLKTGAALSAPAFDSLQRWRVEQKDGMIYVRELIEGAAQTRRTASTVERIVIVGGGAAGNAAAEMLRSEGFAGSVTMLSADAARPCDRPNLSKGTIAGTIQEDYNYLRPTEFYDEKNITLRLNTRVTAIDTAKREVVINGSERMPYDALLLATGADPIRLSIPGADLPHVHTLRTLANSLEIAKQAESARSAVVIGASFIGLEVAAALRARNIDVHVVAPEAVPMTRILGDELGPFMQALHEQHGVTFHLGTTVVSIESDRVQLQNGTTVAADLVIAGIGVRPSTSLAAEAGLTVDNGVIVNEYLETSGPAVYAAGDIARWPADATGTLMRVEHWVVAERQGQTAARNMMGARERFDAVPFFWTEQYDMTLQYTGHAERGFTTTVSGSLDVARPDCRVEFRQGDVLVAVATLGREVENLRAELAFERTHV